MNKNQPHKAIVNVAFSIYPVDNTGELNGQCVNRAQLNADSLKHKMLSVKGSTYEECVANLKELLEKIAKCTR